MPPRGAGTGPPLRRRQRHRRRQRRRGRQLPSHRGPGSLAQVEGPNEVQVDPLEQVACQWGGEGVALVWLPCSFRLAGQAASHVAQDLRV